MRLLPGVVIPLLSLALVQSAATPASSAPRGRRARRTMPAPAPAVILAGDASFRDREVAEACRTALGRSRGGVVAMDPRDGRVIALVNPAQAMFQAYQPCSVFKIVVAVAGLSEGVITPESTHVCRSGCWMWPGHGTIDLRRALAVSCNPYFEWVGERLGYDTIERYAQLLGLGTLTGVNLAGETAGLLPEHVSPEKVGHLSSHAAGIKTSALQLAVMLSTVINGGVVYQPQIVGPRGLAPKERWRLPRGTVISALADGFVSAVNEGSAQPAFDPDVVVAGKTGTCSRIGWFASYAPADQPELVIVVFLRPGSGHTASAVAARVYQQLYKTPQLPMAVAPTAVGGM